MLVIGGIYFNSLIHSSGIYLKIHVKPEALIISNTSLFHMEGILDSIGVKDMEDLARS